MPIVFHGSGAKLLLNKLHRIQNNEPLTESDIKEILSQSDIVEWVVAYESWIEDIWNTIQRILESLHLDSPEGLDKWGSHIDSGFRTAIEDHERMLEGLELLSDFDWAETEQNTLKYLPQGTPIDGHVFLTIDGFNGGMNRGNKTFLSLVFIEPSIMNPAHFTHEFHHSGFTYWWKKHPIVDTWWENRDTKEFWVLALFQYLVSEGLANAYCSPKAIERAEGTDPWIDAHNAAIEEYESNIDSIFQLLESIIDTILADKIDEAKKLYEEFSIDQTGRGIPKGHFLSGRMTQSMERSTKISHDQVIELVQKPFDFFHFYNDAAFELGLKPVDSTLIEKLDVVLGQMKQV